MILVAAVVVLVATVPLAGGRLSRLADLRLRWGWLAITAVLAQVVLISVLPESLPWGAAVAVHLATYGLAGAFVVRNRDVPGLWLIAIGGGCNLVAIAANGGVMPSTSWARGVAGLPVAETGFSNSVALAHPHLVALGDVLGVPGPWPLGNVCSVGDLLLVAGAAVLLHRTCRDQRPVTAEHASSSAGTKRSGRVTHTA